MLRMAQVVAALDATALLVADQTPDDKQARPKQRENHSVEGRVDREAVPDGAKRKHDLHTGIEIDVPIPSSLVNASVQILPM